MQIETNREKKETKLHGSYGFPMLVSYERLSYFETGAFAWHWHPEIELTMIMEGEIAYQVNDTLYHLKAGDGLFCNTNVLHTGRRMETGLDCSYLSITFHPRLLYGYGSSVMQSKYMNPVLKNAALSSIRFSPEVDWQSEVVREMEKIRLLKEGCPLSMELEMQIHLLKIWQLIYEHADIGTQADPENGRDTERIRRIMEYIREHYAENITLEELAEQVHLCRSECCRLFKRYMHETMFAYLLNYRIDRSMELLQDSGKDITTIAGQVGFATPGYFSRIFRRRMGCSPMEYRKRHK